MYNLTSQNPSTSTPSFVFHSTTIRTLTSESGEPLFCLTDVCAALELTQPSNVANQIKGEFGASMLNMAPFETAGGRQTLTVITEPQLYFVMMRGRSSIAHEFRQWICNEVIPAIRKTGSYQTQANAAQGTSLRELMDNATYLLEKAGITGNQLVLGLDRLHKAETGKSLLALTGTVLEAPQQKQLMTPTQIGEKLHLSPQAVNRALAEMGLQRKTAAGWEPTEAGMEKGGTLLDVSKANAPGTVRQLKWQSSIVEEISDNFFSSFN